VVGVVGGGGPSRLAAANAADMLAAADRAAARSTNEKEKMSHTRCAKSLEMHNKKSIDLQRQSS